jgi:hypothetical protein
MKNISCLLIAICILTGPFLSKAYSGDIQLQVKDFECAEDGKIVVHYSLVNSFGFEYNNVILGFKVVEDGKPIACNELKVVVPKDADGSQINELTINTPCSEKGYSLESAIFYYIKRYKIDEWFSGCK